MEGMSRVKSLGSFKREFKLDNVCDFVQMGVQVHSYNNTRHNICSFSKPSGSCLCSVVFYLHSRLSSLVCAT